MKAKRLVAVLISVSVAAALAVSVFASRCAAASTTWQLRYGHIHQNISPFHKYAHEPIARSIEKATNGRVKITIYPAGSLVASRNQLEAVKSGVADMATFFGHEYAGRFPLGEIVNLPFLGFPSGRVASRIAWEVYNKFPEMQAETAGVKILALATTDPYFLITTKKKVTTLADFKGLKLRVPGGPPTDTMKAMGAVPVNVDPAELYLALDRGVIDGAPMSWGLVGEGGFHEVIRYVATNTDFFVYVMYLAINSNVWNSFPPDIQKAIEGVTGTKAAEIYGGNAFDDVENEVRGATIKAAKKVEFYEISKEELAKWQEVAKPVQAKYIADLQAKGLPAQKILDEILRLIGTYK